MSHASGKIEILHVDDRFIHLRYHRAKRPQDIGRVLTCWRDDDAYWLDDLTEVGGADVGDEDLHRAERLDTSNSGYLTTTIGWVRSWLPTGA
jgi:hypothetical protein